MGYLAHVWYKCDAKLLWYIRSLHKLMPEHDDVIKWKHFRDTDPLCGESTGQWRGALIFSLMCAWTNSSKTVEAPVIWDSMTSMWCHCHESTPVTLNPKEIYDICMLILIIHIWQRFVIDRGIVYSGGELLKLSWYSPAILISFNNCAPPPPPLLTLINLIPAGISNHISHVRWIYSIYSVILSQNLWWV